MKLAPMGDPMELRIHGYALTLRLDDAQQIGITMLDGPAPDYPGAPHGDKPLEHPGLGEGGRYHTKAGETPLPEDTTLTFALAGNQNCGKTTLFQPAHWLQPACRQLSRCDRGPQKRSGTKLPRHRGHRPAGHLLHVPLQQ